MKGIANMVDEYNGLKRLGLSGADLPSEIHKAMGFLYHMIVRVDIDSNIALVLINTHSPDAGCTFDWGEYLKYCTGKYISLSDRVRIISHFSSENLKKCVSSGKRSFSCNFSVLAVNAEERHITILAFMPPEEMDSRYAYILVRDTDDDYLLNSIINQYVYDACDYFIYLDAINNSYTMLNGQEGAALPSRICMDYEKEVIDYARAFVAKEDREKVISEMRISRVLEQLDKYGYHSFSCGVIDPQRGYTRKHVEYRYHDKEHRMILLSRTDITDVYVEAEQKRQKLEEALKRAQTDPLTNLLNFRATVDKITEYLKIPEKEYALLFIDIDNFKNINDSLGHLMGDELLRNIAECLVVNSKENDIIGRVGGDEFVFFTELEDKEKYIDAIGRKICKTISSVKISDEHGNHVTGSVGIAIAPFDGTDYYALVTKADKGVYEAKKSGKNRYSF